MALEQILTVGAGPAGLLLALLLAKAGVKVQVLERAPEPTEETRAVFYNASSQFEFKRAGIFDDVMEEALVPNAVAFRDLQGKVLFEMPGNGQVALLQKKLAKIIQKHLKEVNVDILWGHTVTGIGQDGDQAWVEVETAGGSKRFEAQYVVGCDGASSAIRKGLFGEKSLPGMTWDKHLMAADIRYDLKAALPNTVDSNIFIDAENAWLAFRPDKDELHWRVIYRDEDQSEEKLKELLPGSDYELIGIRTYKIHQRLVDKMRKGRFILAGDAAHLTCPYGALGLNGAVADVGSLYDCLVAIHTDKADDSILDVYSDVRREKFQKVTDPQSRGTLKTVFSNPEDIVPNHPVYKFSQLLKNNPQAAKANGPDPMALRYDFAPHLRE